jgi:hypothetical protein
MANDVSGADLFNLIRANNAPMRAQLYRMEAEKFRQMAEAETNNGLRLSLSRLAEQYGELASSLSQHSR